jgi:hypothetical protein
MTSQVLSANGSDSCWYGDHDLPQVSTNVTYYKPNHETFMSNLKPDGFTGKDDLQVVLGLVYTTTCGIMVGANLSGDLEDPGKSLPRGTLAAMFTSFVT